MLPPFLLYRMKEDTSIICRMPILSGLVLKSQKISENKFPLIAILSYFSSPKRWTKFASVRTITPVPPLGPKSCIATASDVPAISK